MASTYLTKTFGSDGDRQKWTWSAWIKRSGLGSSNALIGAGGGSNQEQIYFADTDRLDWWIWTSNAYKGRLTTNKLFRDNSGWYHIVCVYDSANATAGDRMKIYVNGVEDTYITDDNPNDTIQSWINSTTEQQIGASGNGSNDFDGYMSHIHFCDGYAYSASDFGETDATSGVWKIKTSPSVNYGTNGYFILKDGNSVTDQSSNSNNFTVSAGTLTNMIDNPSDVFATWNPLQFSSRDIVYSNGNTTGTDSGGADWSSKFNIATLGMNTGKYYFENKISAIGTNQMYPIGILSDPEATAFSSSLGGQSNGYGYYAADGRIIANGNDLQTGMATATTGDIIGCAFDATNGTMQIYKNGTAIGSQVTSIPTTDRTWFFACGWYDNSAVEANFGNGYFGTSQVASAGTNASGNGIFEYDVPTGYTALCTKGLNE